MENLAVSSPNRVSIFQQRPLVLTKKIIFDVFGEHKIKIAELSRPLLLLSFGGETYLDEFSRWQNQGCKSFEKCSSTAKKEGLVEFSCLLCRFFS